MPWFSTSYDALTLDHIHQLTTSDNDLATEIDEQSSAAGRLYEELGRSVKILEHARSKISNDDWDGIGKVFEGATAQKAFEQVESLLDSGSGGQSSMAPQSAVFSGIAQRVRDTQTGMEELRERREKLLKIAEVDPEHPKVVDELSGDFGLVPPEQVPERLREKFDRDARDLIQSSADGYLDEASSLPSTVPYDGPRVPREGGPGPGDGDSGIGSVEAGTDDPGGNGRRSAPGPSLNYGVGSHSPAPSYPIDSSGPALQSGPAPSLPAVATSPVPAAPVATGPGMLPPAGLFVPSTPMTAPVIGARGPGFGVRGTPSLRPNTNGVVRPVIGERPGKAGTAYGPTPRTVARPAAPVPGQARPPIVRPGVAADGRSTLGPGRSAGTSVVRNPSTAPRPGVRQAPTSTHEPAGRVITSRSARQGTVTRKRPEFSRTPKIVHGGNDGLNRPVIRNSRAPAPPRRTTTTVTTGGVDKTDSWWQPTSVTVSPVIRGGHLTFNAMTHDPGPILTRHNLGFDR